jgi:threonine dehydrogenase-like Zn-dependent dehydrogenase
VSVLALELHRSLPRYLATRALGRRAPGTLTAGLAPLRLASTEEPRVDAEGWGRVAPRLAGICGSDLGMLSGSTSPYFSPLVSFPFTPGHEIVGELVDDVADLPRGTRVVVDPLLGCRPRGLPACDQCRNGRPGRCAHITVGHLAAGLQTGYCASTGGGWSSRLAAHRSQLHPVPEDLPDRRAVLVEPLACALHAAQRAAVGHDDQVLVVGSGAVGLLTVLALRAVTEAGRILVTAKHPRQAASARALGASTVVDADGALSAVRRATRAFRLQPELGADFLLGGVDVAIDCVGSRSSLDLALRATRAGGRVVLTGMPPPGVDLAPAWFRELHLLGAYASSGGPSEAGEGDATASRTSALTGTAAEAGTASEATSVAGFPTALELAATAPLDELALATYPLQRWRQALDHALDAGRLGTTKVAFDLTDRR